MALLFFAVPHRSLRWSFREHLVKEGVISKKKKRGDGGEEEEEEEGDLFFSTTFWIRNNNYDENDDHDGGGGVIVSRCASPDFIPEVENCLVEARFRLLGGGGGISRCCGENVVAEDTHHVFGDSGHDDGAPDAEGWYKVLLLGAGNVGKSTMFRQLRGDKDNAHFSVTNIIFTGVANFIREAAKYSAQKGTPVDLQSYGISEGEDYGNHPDPTNFPRAMKSDWFQQAWEEWRVLTPFEHPMSIEMIEYVLPRIDEMVLSDYKATFQDELMMRIRTTGIVELEIQEESFNFRIFDTGGERSERKKWIHCFEGVSCVTFVVDITGYARVLYEDSATNSEKEQVLLFDEIFGNRYFLNTPVILLLNKMDLLERVLPFQPPSTLHDTYLPENNDYQSTLDFIAQRYITTKPNAFIFAAFTNASAPTFRQNYIQFLRCALNHEQAGRNGEWPNDPSSFMSALICGEDVMRRCPSELSSSLHLRSQAFVRPPSVASAASMVSLAVPFADDEDCEKVATAMRHLPSLQNIYLTRGTVTTVGVETLSSSLISLSSSSSSSRTFALNFSKNKINAYPPTLLSIPNLTKLVLSNNDLDSELPSSIEGLKSLVELDVQKSTTINLSPSLAACASIKKIWVDVDRMKTPPSEVCLRGTKHMIQYLLASLSSGQVENKQVRVMVVGLGEVGKTSLISSLVNEKGVTESDGTTRRKNTCVKIDADLRTIGIDVNSYIPTDSDVVLDFWDFAGQKVYYITHAFFLSRRAIFVLAWRPYPPAKLNRLQPPPPCAVCQKRVSFSPPPLSVPSLGVTHIECVDFDSSIATWVKKINFRVPGATILLVATHADVIGSGSAEVEVLRLQGERVKREVEHTLEQQTRGIKWQLSALDKLLTSPGRAPEMYAQAQRRRDQLSSHPPAKLCNDGDSFFVSSTTGAGIDELRKSLVDFSKKMDFYGEKVPISFEKLKTKVVELQKQGVTWMPRTDFDAMANKEALDAGAQLELSLSFLSDLGSILYFPSSPPPLRDTVIVDPRWAVKLMKSVVAHSHGDLTSNLAALDRAKSGEKRDQKPQQKQDGDENMPDQPITLYPFADKMKTTQTEPPPQLTASEIRKMMRDLDRNGILHRKLLHLLWNDVVADASEHSVCLQMLESLEVIVSTEEDNGGKSSGNSGDAATPFSSSEAVSSSYIIPALLNDARLRPLTSAAFANNNDSKKKQTAPNTTTVRKFRFVFPALPDGFLPLLVARLRKNCSHFEISKNCAAVVRRGRSSLIFIVDVKKSADVFHRKQRGISMKDDTAQVHLIVSSSCQADFALFKKEIDSLDNFFPGLLQTALLIPCVCPTCSKIHRELVRNPQSANRPAYFPLMDIGLGGSGTMECPLSKIKVNISDLLPPEIVEVALSANPSRSLPSTDDVLTLRSRDVVDQIFDSLTKANISVFRTVEPSPTTRNFNYTLNPPHVFICCLNRDYGTNPFTITEYRSVVLPGRNTSIIPIILPDYGELSFPRWYPPMLPELDGLLFVDLRQVSTSSDVIAPLVAQTLKLLEVAGSELVREKSNASAISRNTSDAQQTQTTKDSSSTSKLMCPSCLTRGIAPPFFFDKIELSDDFRAGQFTAMCEYETVPISISEIMPPEIFLSYNWGEKLAVGATSHGSSSTAVFRNQERIKEVKAKLTEVAGVSVWLDIERMGGGNVLDEEMKTGVRKCCVVVVCLDDNYIKSINCLKEFEFALSFGRHIVPLLMPELSTRFDTQWWPSSLPKIKAFRPVMYRENDIESTVEELANRVEALFRRDTLGSGLWRIAADEKQEQEENGGKDTIDNVVEGGGIAAGGEHDVVAVHQDGKYEVAAC